MAIAVGLAMTASGRENGADAKNTGSRNLPFGNGGPQCENNLGITGGPTSRTVVKPAASVTAAL